MPDGSEIQKTFSRDASGRGKRIHGLDLPWVRGAAPPSGPRRPLDGTRCLRRSLASDRAHAPRSGLGTPKTGSQRGIEAQSQAKGETNVLFLLRKLANAEDKLRRWSDNADTTAQQSLIESVEELESFMSPGQPYSATAKCAIMALRGSYTVADLVLHSS
jgi:hypothetical protein